MRIRSGIGIGKRAGSASIALVMVSGLLGISPSASAGVAHPAEVMWLDFAEGSGTQASDASGHGNDGELLYGAAFDGTTLALDGVDDVVAVDSSASLDFDDAITVSGWVYRSANKGGWRSVISRQLAGDSRDQFFLGLYNGEARFGIGTTGGGSARVRGPAVPIGEWVHLAGTYNRNRLRLYVDGVQRASDEETAAIASSTRPVLVGGNANGADPLDAVQTWVGNIDDARLHDAALSATQIGSLMGAPPADPTPPSGSASHVLSLPFDEVDGTTASDVSGNDNDAELLNGATFDSGTLALDGIDDLAAVDDSPSLHFSSELTVSAWVKRASDQESWRSVVSRQLATDSRNQFFLAFFDGKPRFGIETADAGGVRVQADPAPVGEWVHLTGVYNRNRIRLYVDGAQEAAIIENGRIADSDRPILIGGNANGVDPLAAIELLEGNVEDVNVYARALNAQQVLDLSLVRGGEPIHQAPVIDSIGPQEGEEGGLLEFDVTATDPNEEDDITLSVEDLPNGATFDPATGEFSWSPGYRRSGVYRVIFRATDPGGLFDTEQVKIIISNVPKPSTAITLGVKKGMNRLKASGDVAPQHPDHPGRILNVALYKLRNSDGSWRKKGTESPTLSNDHTYEAFFERPNPGTYKIVAKFPASSHHKASKAKVRFEINN